jgi:hypothetical protein
MHGSIPPLPNKPSWHGAQLKKAQGQLDLHLYLTLSKLVKIFCQENSSTCLLKTGSQVFYVYLGHFCSVCLILIRIMTQTRKTLPCFLHLGLRFTSQHTVTSLWRSSNNKNKHIAKSSEYVWKSSRIRDQRNVTVPW